MDYDGTITPTRPQTETATSTTNSTTETNTQFDQIANLTSGTEQVSLGSTGSTNIHFISDAKNDAGGGALTSREVPLGEVSDFKAMAADASVFTFGDEDDYESD